MSQENVEIVRRLVDAWNRQDPEAVLAPIHPEGEYVNAPAAVEPGTRRGHDEIVAVMRKQWEILSNPLLEIDRLDDRGDEIITVARVSRTMPGSDARISNPIVFSWKFRDGKLIRLEQLGGGANFPDALKAAGLSEWAMSQENVEIVKAAIAATNRGDWDAVISYAAPNCRWDASRDLGEWRGVYETPEGVRRALEGFYGLWESWRIEIDELIEVGEETVVTRQTGSFRGRDGIEVTTRTNWVWRFRDGAGTEFTSYPSWNEALEAAGLAE